MRLELRLGKAAADGYPVTVQPPEGEPVSGWVRWPVTGSDEQLDRRLRHIDESLWLSSAKVRWAATSLGEAVRRLGQELFEALPKQVREVLTGSLEQAEQEGKQLRVMLTVEPPELARLPWEFLYVPERPGTTYRRVFPFLNHHLVRYPPASPQRPLWTRLPLRVLAMVGHADGIDVEEEKRRLTDAMRSLERDGLVELEWVRGHGWRDLLDRLRSGPKPNIVHVIAHGEYDEHHGATVLLLEDDDGRPYRLPPDRLTTFLRGRPSIRLVVLNSCGTGLMDRRDSFSSVANALVACGIPAVVGMQFRISDPAAVAFARSFYGALARRRSVAAGVTAARQDIPNELADSLEWGTPVLYAVDPDEIIFDVRPARLRWDPNLIATVTAPRDVNAVTFSADSGWLALACDRSGLWQVPTGPLASVPSRRPRPPEPARTSLYGVAFSQSGAWLAAAGLDGTVQIWQPGGDQPRLAIAHPDWVVDVAVSPAGRLATACADGLVRLYDIATGDDGWHPLSGRTLNPRGGVVRTVTFDSTGDRIAIGCDGRTAQVWDFSAAPTDTPAAVLRHRRRVFGVAFSPDGHLLATASQDGWVRLWRWSAAEPDERPLKAEWRCHRGWALDVAWSPDGQRLATAGRDRTAKVWDVHRQESELTISHRGTVRRVAFSPDGRWLATASYDRTCQMWQFDREE